MVPCSFPSSLRGKTTILRRVGKQEGKEKRNMEKTGESQRKNPEETEVTRKTCAMFISKVVYDLNSLSAKMKIKPLKMLLI